MTEQVRALYASFENAARSGTSWPIESKPIYYMTYSHLEFWFLSDYFHDLASDIAGDAWTYQHAITLINGVQDNHGVILYFNDPNHALLFKLASDLDLEVWL